MSTNPPNGSDQGAADLAALSSQLFASRAELADRIMAQLQSTTSPSAASQQPSKKRKKDTSTADGAPRPPTLGLGAVLPSAGSTDLGTGPSRSDNRLKGALSGGARARGARRDEEMRLAEDRKAAEEARQAQEEQEEEERRDGRSNSVKRRKGRRDPFAQPQAAAPKGESEASRSRSVNDDDNSHSSVQGGNVSSTPTTVNEQNASASSAALTKAADLAGAQAAERAAAAGMGKKAQKKVRKEARERVLRGADVDSQPKDLSAAPGESAQDRASSADKGEGLPESDGVTRSPNLAHTRLDSKEAGAQRLGNGTIDETWANEQPITSSRTALQNSAAAQLAGARFRSINESLYTSSGAEAVSLAKADATRMQEYHKGFRSQTQGWPLIPVDAIVRILCNAKVATKSRAGKHVQNPLVVDLGAGEAPLAKALTRLSSEASESSHFQKVAPKKKLSNTHGHAWSVISFDLDTSPDGWVVGANVAQHVPLPGSHQSPAPLEGQEPVKKQQVLPKGGKGIAVAHAVPHASSPGMADVVVFCLALMGTDWMGMILEAYRILKEGGDLIIAEVSSRHTSIEAFTDLICQAGFELRKKDSSNSHFSLFEFLKVERCTATGTLKKQVDFAAWRDELCERGQKVLKPCLYKRR